MQKSFNIKILFSFILSALIVLGTATPANIKVEARSTSEIKADISELEAKSAELEKKINKLKKEKAGQQQIKDALQSQISATQAEISACASLISGYKAEISKYQAEINKKNEEIAETKFLYKKRMRSIYMSGSTNNNLLILLNSESFSEYLALSEVSKTISAHDKKLINSMNEAIKVINKAKAKINEKISAQNAVKQTLANKQAKLKSQQAEISSVISSINANQNKLENENKQYEKAIDALEAEIRSKLNGATIGGKNPVFVSAKFTWPCPGYYNLTSYFGQRWGRLHGGIDISSAGIEGKPIVAAAAGVVISAGYNNGGYGNWVMINHGTNAGKQYATVYGHMKYTPPVRAGQTVKAGQVIGYVGNTGRSFGNHLHFEVRVNGNRVNPLNYFNKAK